MRKPIQVENGISKDQDQQATGVGATGFRVRPQPLGKELDKDAQVWEIYVEETDRFDAELVKEWNDSLDVLLIFAALFSAITTALVLESAKQLQRDPAEASVQTLLAISQTLVAISNGQKVDGSPTTSSSSPDFSPSRTSVLVNALWFLSLSLSVAVSLVAMLSKSWCHAFMATRSGPKYEQGRRRQRKWTGIERWGMESVFMYLPTLMHLALLLFAIGLAVYLWDINIKVASPVVALAVVSVLLYAIATFLPLVGEDCPYSTPLSKPLKQVPAIFLGLKSRIPWDTLQNKYKHISERAQQSTPLTWAFNYVPGLTLPTRVTAYLKKLRDISRRILWHHQQIDDDSPFKRQADETPMDLVTSHMLCWLVGHCEDKRLVDIALQSVAGACGGLPRAPLVESNVIELVAQNIRGCFDHDRDEGSLRLKASVSIDSALLYTRALSWLVTNDTKHGLPFDSWSAASKQPYTIYSKPQSCKTLAKFVGEFQSHYFRLKWSYGATEMDADIAAIVTSIVIPSRHYTGGDSQAHPEWRHDWSWEYAEYSSDSFKDRSWSTQLIRSHLDKTALLQHSAFLALLEAVPHALIECMLDMDIGIRNESIMVVVQLVHDPACTSVEFQHAIGLILAIAATLMQPYPGWKRPLAAPKDFQARAAEVYNCHKTRRYEDSRSLILFGLFGLLRKADSFGPADIFVVVDILTRIKHWDTETPKSIHTVPGAPSLEKPLSHVVLKCIQAAAGRETGAHAYESKSRQLLRSFPDDAVLSSIEGEDFELGLKLFCTVPHTQLRRACLKVLDLGSNAGNLDQDNREYYSFRFAELAEPTLMSRLLHLSFGTEDVYIAPYAMRYLWKMTERLMWEAGRQPEGEPATILAQVLQTEAFVSLKEKVPSLPATPRNVFETGLADVWYPLLAEMSGHKSTAQVVVESNILPWMEYTSEERVKDTYPHATELQQDGRKWLEIIQELRNKCDSVIDATE